MAFIYSGKTLFSTLEIIPFGYTKKGQPYTEQRGIVIANHNDDWKAFSLVHHYRLQPLPVL